jgi:hypothetical protein
MTTDGRTLARQGWGVVLVVGTMVALVPWFVFAVRAGTVSDSCTDASEAEQHLSMIPTVIALAVPIAYVIWLRKRSPVGYVAVALTLLGVAVVFTALLWTIVSEPYTCD